MRSCDVAIVGAGAAGLATAIFARRRNPRVSVVLLDGARSPGAKILVSGGSRCTVTNASVSERDFWGGSPAVVRRILRSFPVADTIAFFREIGVTLHEETDGKLFPDTNRARDVLDALLRELSNVGASLRAGERVTDIARGANGLRIATATGVLHANVVVLATGGQSLPKTGSDGVGLAIAARLGHTIVPTTPGLVPLVLAEDDRAMHRELTGVAQPVELSIWVGGRIDTRLRGSMLWTHFGVSGPVAMNGSRHWLRAQLDRRACRVTINFCPGDDFDAVDRRWNAACARQPRASLQTALGNVLPASVASAIVRRLGLDPATELAHLARGDRRRLVHALVAWPLAVTGSRGYNFAEVTAGGVSLTEIDPATLQSRRCPGLFLAGEMLDVDGRIGGFNFQWAWSSGYVAGRAAAIHTGPRQEP